MNGGAELFLLSVTPFSDSDIFDRGTYIMQLIYFFICALLFSIGDYLCSLNSNVYNRTTTTALGALVGVTGYLVFAILSRNTPLYALAGYINGAVVVISCVVFGYLVQGNSIRPQEWFWLSVILLGIIGLAYARTA